MADRGRKMDRSGLAVALAGLALLAAILLSLAMRQAGTGRAALEQELRGLRDRIVDMERQTGILREEVVRLGTVPVTVYFERSTETDIFLVPVQRRVSRDDPQLHAVLALIEGPRADEPNLRSPIPEGTRVLSLRVEGRTATVDFSTELTRTNVGSAGEAVLVGSIVNTLTEFPGIDNVQLLVQGRRIESIAGHVDASRPLRRDETLIRR